MRHLALALALFTTAPAFADDAPTRTPAVVINGGAVAAASAAAAGIPAGAYWYDPVSSLWGYTGGPAVGQITLPFTVPPVPANASGSGSGVFVNGREVHPLDVQWLQARLGRVAPGRYVLRATGEYGLEGGPILGNLLAGPPAGTVLSESSTGTTTSMGAWTENGASAGIVTVRNPDGSSSSVSW